MASTAIIIPCYNEAARLPVEKFRAFAREHDDIAFVFVNDGSRDGTLALIQGLAAERPASFTAIDLPVNGGKAEAVRQGFVRTLAAQPALQRIGFWDADLATPLDAIPGFCALLDARPQIEMLIGSRVQLQGRQIERELRRHYLGRLFATAVSLMLGIRVYDTQCGAKLFRVNERAREVFAQPFVSRWIFDVEIIMRYRAARAQAALDDKFLLEEPLQAWRDVDGSKVRPRDFVRAALDLMKIRNKYR